MLSHDLVHRDVVWQRVDGADGKACKAHADDSWFLWKGCERPVEISAAISETEVLAVIANHRRQKNVWVHSDSTRRNWDAPKATDQRLARPPCAEHQRCVLFHHERQRTDGAARGDAGEPPAQIRLSSQWPVEAHRHPDEVGEALVEALGNADSAIVTILERHGKPF